MWATRRGGTGEAPETVISEEPVNAGETGGTGAGENGGTCAPKARYDRGSQYRVRFPFAGPGGQVVDGYLQLEAGSTVVVQHIEQHLVDDGEPSGWAYGINTTGAADGLVVPGGWFPQRVLPLRSKCAYMVGAPWSADAESVSGVMLSVQVADWVCVTFWTPPDGIEAEGWAFGRLLGEPGIYGWLPRRLLRTLP